ncbi:MAG: alpha/beta hydrolase [Vicingaceae bacterium]
MKKTILLLHGALGSKKQFSHLISTLDHNSDVHAINFSGHGGMEIKEAYSMKLFMENVNDYVAKNQLQNVHIFGYSMGGYVALKLAASGAKFIQSISTLGTKFDWSEKATGKELKMLNPEKIEEKVPKFAASLKTEHQGEDWKKVVEQTAKMMLYLSQKEQLRNSDLQKINIPVTIALGDTDVMVSQAESQWAVNHLPNAQFKIIKNCPHPLTKVPIEAIKELILI